MDILLTDLLGLDHLQALQDNFASLTGIATILVDPDAIPITKPSQINLYSQLLQSTPEGDRLRFLICKELCVKNRREKGFSTVVSARTGLITGAVPIFLDKLHLGSWIVGQVAQTELDEERLCQRAMEMGISCEEVLPAIATVPIMTDQEFREIFRFLGTLTQTVIQLAQVNFEMMRSNQNLVELTERLDSTAQMLAKFTNSADVGMYVTDFFTGEMLQANDRYARYLGMSLDSLIGRPCWTTYDPSLESFCPDCPHDKLLDSKGHPSKPIVWEREIPQRSMWVQFTNQAIYWVDGRLAHMVTFTDITKTKRMQEQLARLAYYDRTMHLPNSLKLLSDLQDSSITAQYHLICFDIVSLRTINDVYSRRAGDVLLQKIAQWVAELEVPGAQLYRIDGDEFGLLLRDLDRSVAQELTRRLYTRFEEPWVFAIDGERMHIFCSVSAGVVSVDKPVESAGEDLLSLIERTLANARTSGRIAVYDEAMDLEYRENLKLEMSLRSCVKEGMKGFAVCYQPIVDPTTGSWCSLEALCRWTSPDCGEVPPLVFIHKAEQMGLIGALGRWVLETAVRQCKSWELDKLDGFILDVNLSPVQMNDETMVGWILDLLEECAYPGEKLSLEITESAEMNFQNHTLQAMEKLRQANVMVALDDFGTGYSSFNNLKQLPVSILKTERAFLENIENDSYLQYLLYVMVELAHAAGMKLIAEGVENQEQMRILLKNGVDYLQGYLFSPPLPTNELEAKLGNFKAVSTVFHTMHHEPIDMHRLLGNGYTVPPNLFKLMNQCMQILLLGIDTDKAINEALGLVGGRFNVSRAFVFWKGERDTYSNSHEWSTTGLPRPNSLDVPTMMRVIKEELVPLFLDKGMLVAKNVTSLPPSFRERIVPKDVKALALIPIWQGEELQGMVGFDECASFRDWLPEEILMLHNLGLLLATVLEKRSLEQAVLQRSEDLGNLLNSMDVLLYVADPSTRRILFANKKLEETFGPVGERKCYQILQKRTEPCQPCRINLVKKNSDNPQCIWEQYDTETGRHYRVHASSISWLGGKKAHLEYAVDITAIKEYQEQLELFVSTDTFTKTLNRNTLLERLHNLFTTLSPGIRPVTVCFVDVDRLKYVNDNYGHMQGDALILGVVEALKKQMGPEDLLGRYGGDEFVLTLLDCPQTQAEQRMEAALEELQHASKHAPLQYHFSYGLVEPAEVPYQDGQHYVEKLLEMADYRMLRYKHKHRSELQKATPSALR